MVASALLFVDFTQQDNVLKLYPELPLLSSDRAGWNGIQLQYHRLSPHKLDENYSKQHRIIVHDRSPSPPLVEEMIEHRFQAKQFGGGDVTVVPADVLNSACWNTEYEFITLSFEPSLFARYTFDLTTLANVEFIPSFSRPDSLIHSIGIALKSEVECSGTGSRLYIDSLTAALMAHLLRHYSTQKTTSPVDPNELPKQKLKQVLDYIRQHLEQDLALHELAAIAHMSPSYFSTSFKQSIGVSPHQYVIQLKIERAKQLLLRKELSIAEVAHMLGFSHQSHLNRHFKRLVGATPKAFLKSQ